MNTNFLSTCVGFFMGEGSIKLPIQKPANSVHIQLAIGVRGDDYDALGFFQDTFGGSLGRYPSPTPTGKMSSQARWSLNKTHEVLSFLMVLKECEIPFKKMQDVAIGIKFCEWRMSFGHRVGDWTYAFQLREKLMALHQFDYS